MTKTMSNRTILLGIAVLMLVSSSMVAGIGAAAEEAGPKQQEMTELEEKAQGMDTTSRDFFDLIKRDELSAMEIKQAEAIIKNDSRLASVIGNDTLETASISFEGNANTLPVKWYPIVHMINGTNVTSAKLDLDTNEVKSIDTYEGHKLGLGNAYAISEYAGSPDLLKGISVTSENQPVNYNGSKYHGGFAALLLNAKMCGSDRDKLCSAAYFPSHYWLQAGLLFNDKGWRYVYADTTTNCMATRLVLPELSATDDTDTKIYSGATWWVVLHNKDKNDFMYYSRSGPDSGWIQKGDESTGVFFENGHAGSGWDSRFEDGDLSLTDARVQKSDSSWSDWSGAS